MLHWMRPQPYARKYCTLTLPTWSYSNGFTFSLSLNTTSLIGDTTSVLYAEAQRVLFSVVKFGKQIETLQVVIDIPAVGLALWFCASFSNFFCTKRVHLKTNIKVLVIF